MALIHINADGSFEAVAAKRTYATEIKALKDAIAAIKRGIADYKKKLSPLKRIAGLKLQLQHADTKRAAKIKEQIEALRHKYIIGPKATIKGTERAIAQNEAKIGRLEKRIARLAEAEAKQKEKAKAQPKAPTRSTRNDPRLDGPKPSRANPGQTKRTVTRKVSFDTEARRASSETVRGIKGKLRELDAQSKLPAAKKKPAAATVKHPGSVKTGAKATVLASIKQLKADIAKGLSGPKLVRAQAELKKQRAALRQLRKGESAANQAAVQPRPKASKAGIGSGLSAAAEKRIASLRAKLKPLKPGSPEYRQIMTKIKTLQGRSPTGGNR